MPGPSTSLTDDTRLAEALDAATLDSDGWHLLIDQLMLRFGGEGGGINIADPVTGQSRAAINLGLSATAEAEYYRHLIHKDPRLRLLAGMTSGTAADDAPLLADAASRRDEYYAWQAEQGFRGTLFFKLVHNRDELGAIAITRAKASRAPDAATLAAAQALAPRLAAVAAINRRLTALEGINAALERTIAAGGQAFALFGPGARLLHANTRYIATLDRRDGLNAEIVGQAVRTAEAAGQPHAIAIARHGGGRPYRLVLQPVSAAAGEARRFDWGRQGAVLAFLDDPDAGRGRQDPVLQQLYGLTAAEARVATLIADGEDVDGIARAQGVTVNTVRTQLKSVFAKMGVSRQLGVAQLVRSLPQFDG